VTVLKSPFGRGALLLPLALGLAAVVGGCRGGVSEDPPINLVPDMDDQAHRLPQSISSVFGDKRSMRKPEPHTVARNHLKQGDDYEKGLDTKGAAVARLPVEVTQALLDRGEERFNIYCAPCHDKTGSGNGAVPQRLKGKPDEAAFSGIPHLWDQRLVDTPDGDIFNTISHGKNRMPSYAAQIPVEDRWAIVAHVRVLQNLSKGAGAAK
jgi:mono/diheme cytochrome c family protein